MTRGGDGGAGMEVGGWGLVAGQSAGVVSLMIMFLMMKEAKTSAILPMRLTIAHFRSQDARTP